MKSGRRRITVTVEQRQLAKDLGILVTDIPVIPPCDQQHYEPGKPDGYIAFFEWCDKMARTHTQRKCTMCGLWKVWRRSSPSVPAAKDAEVRR